jgi:hypothetical protein
VSTVQPRPGPQPVRRARIALILWAIAAVASIALLAVAIVVSGRSEGPTLRAMAASESMPDDQARSVAENTVRVWVRERNAGNLANAEALTCPLQTLDGTLALEMGDVKEHKPRNILRIRAIGAFTRNGATWTLNVHFQAASVMFVLQVRDGELRVCHIDPAPVP